MASQKLKLTDKVDTFAAWFWIVACAAPVVWCANTGLDFGRIVDAIFALVVVYYVFGFIFVVVVGIVGGILGGNGK